MKKLHLLSAFVMSSVLALSLTSEGNCVPNDAQIMAQMAKTAIEVQQQKSAAADLEKAKKNLQEATVKLQKETAEANAATQLLQRMRQEKAQHDQAVAAQKEQARLAKIDTEEQKAANQAKLDEQKAVNQTRITLIETKLNANLQRQFPGVWNLHKRNSTIRALRNDANTLMKKGVDIATIEATLKQKYGVQ